MTTAEHKKPAERLKRWRTGADGFFAWLADVQPMVPSEKGGYRPAEFSEREAAELRRALDGDFSTVVLCWPRRHGKTVAAALIIVWRFLTRRTQTVAIVANSERQSVDTAFKLVRTIVEQTPYIKAMVDAGAIEVLADVIRYEAAGNVIQGFPANPAALYGKKLSVAQVSELHAARTDTTFQTLASATIDSDDGLVLVDSTVGSRASPLWALAQVAERGDDPTLFYSHIQYRDLEDAIANGPAWIKPARLRSRAAQMLPVEFAQQHLNQWGSSSAALFTPDILDRCAEAYPLDVKALTDGAAYVVGGGLDRAYGFSLNGDSTVATAVLKTLVGEDEHVYVLDCRDIRFSSARGIKSAFTSYASDFGMSRAAIEAYNAQDIAAWCADQAFDHELVHPTAERQAGAFTALFQLARDGRLHIHQKFDRLLKELAALEVSIQSTGTSKGSLPRFEAAKGSHDDHAYSLAWAVYSLRDVELNPYEVAGIHCDATGPAVRLCILNGGNLTPPCADACRSFQAVKDLHDKYMRKNSLYSMALADFFRDRVSNIGSHTVRR